MATDLLARTTSSREGETSIVGPIPLGATKDADFTDGLTSKSPR